MNNKQKMSLLTLGLCVSLSVSAHAGGAPASQFGFSGWPYRQETGCGNASAQPTATCTAAPMETALPTPTWEPTRCPTQTPAATPRPEEPAVSASPEFTPAPTAAPTATAAPVQTPAATATKAPTPAPTATKVPQMTEKPIETTPVPSTSEDYTTGSVSAQEENAFLLLNADRAANGRSALALDPALCSLARMKSLDMYQNRYFAHTSPTYGSAAQMLKTYGYSYTSVGENIAHHATVEKAQAAFMTSTGHRQNILGSQWTKVGIGVCYDSQGFVYVTQLFVR